MTDLSVDLSVEASSQAWTPALLSPVLWFDSRSLSAASTTWTNQGTGGSALDGTFGATTAAPRVLTHTGTNYLYLPGTASNYASTPTSTVLDALTGDIEVVFRADVQAFTVSAGYLSRGGCWRVIANAVDGTKLHFGYWNGLSWSEVISNTGLLQSGVRWYRVRRVVSSGVVTWETANDSTVEPSAGWSSFGSVALNAGVALPTAANPLEVGSRDLGTGPMTGSMYRAIVRNGIGGTVVFDADFTTGIASGAQTGIFDSSSNNAAITINRSASGYKATAVVRPTLLFGGGQYVDVADNALLNFDASTSQTVIAVTRQWGTPVSFGRIVDKKNGGGIGLGWSLSNVATTIQPGLYLGDGTNQSSATGSAGSSGALAVYTGVVDRTSNIETAYLNPTAGTGTSTATIATLVNALPMRVGAAANALGSYHEGEINAVLVFRRVLTAAEIQQVCDYYTYNVALSYTVGTLTTSAGYNILTFNGSGTFTPGRNLPVEYLVVAGGGGGGGGTSTAFFGGGGGAGGYLTNVGTTKFVLSSTQQTITIGAGGAGGSLSGTTGNDSSIGGSIVARGGGFGGGTFVIGGNGGSGGGGGRQRAGGLPVAGQGNAGGTSNLSTFASGGGGAGTAGSNGSANTGGNGGNGLSSSISGASVTYAGGGGGSGFTTPGTGGTGGGANGAVDIVGNAGTANTGGGGGGTGSTAATTNIGGQGGSGIVIIRWPA